MLAQIGVFVEFERLRDVTERENNVLDRRAAGIEAGTDVFANLFDLRMQIAFAHNVAGVVERDLAPDDDPSPRNAILVVGGEAAHGGPTISGTGKSSTTSQAWSACRMRSLALSRHNCII